MLVKNERSFALIQRIQSKKAPMEDRKKALSDELTALYSSIDARVKEINDELKQINAELAPLDKLALEAHQAGGLKNREAGDKLLADLEGRV